MLFWLEILLKIFAFNIWILEDLKKLFNFLFLLITLMPFLLPTGYVKETFMISAFEIKNDIDDLDFLFRKNTEWTCWIDCFGIKYFWKFRVKYSWVWQLIKIFFQDRQNQLIERFTTQNVKYIINNSFFFLFFLNQKSKVIETF